MNGLDWMCFILAIGSAHFYENLSLKNGTSLSQSSTYNNRFPSYANDGDLRTKEFYCAHTAGSKPIAWFQVDLGIEYSIKSVTIYYRKEGNGLKDWKQYRFKQFYLDVSNSSAAVTNTTQRTRCYTDTSTDLPDNIIDIPCKQTARYIIVETTYDAPEDDFIDEHGAILEICEIQVYGCEIGSYGEECHDCSGCQTCDVVDGACPPVPCSVNCMSGLCNSTTGYCTQGCIDGYWGSTCTSTCPPNSDRDQCDNLRSSTSTMTIVSITACATLVLTWGVMGWLLWRRSHSQNVKRGLKENHDSQTTTHEYSDLPNSEHLYVNQFRSPYEEIGNFDKPNIYEDLHQFTKAV